MKKTKRLFAIILSVLLLSGLSGCGIFSTRMARAIQKMSKLESFQFELEASLELALCLDTAETEDDAPEQDARRSLPISGSFTGNGEFYTDPFRLHLDSALTLPGLTSRQTVYAEKEESAYYLYSRANEGSIWQKQGLAAWSAGKVNGIKYLVEAAAFFEEGEIEQVGGYTAQRYDGVFPGDYLAGLFELYHVREFLCEGLGLQLEEGVLEEVAETPASIWLDTDSGMVVRLDAELGEFARVFADGQLEATRDALGLDKLGLSLELEELHLSLRLSSFDGAEAFQIPDEAKSAWGDSVKPWE